MKLDGSDGGVSCKVRENVSKVRHLGYLSESYSCVGAEVQGQECRVEVDW